jgi:hypothetical protein
MFVDDNFIGAKKDVRALLAALAAWRRRTRAPLEFFTEASIDLADRPELVRAMTNAGFGVVFVGIETPREASLRESGKRQNLRRDLVEQVRGLRRQGLDVWAGFILGFDADDPEVFDEMIGFVEDAGIAYAMVGLLMALPGTALHARLVREGRLRPEAASGDQFAMTNVVTRLPAAELALGAARVLEALYDPTRYFARCHEHLRHFEPAPGPAARPTAEDVAVVARSLWQQGVRGRYRGSYWRFLARVLRESPHKLPLALAQACAGHHFITYTRETAAPGLRRAAAAASVGVAPAASGALGPDYGALVAEHLPPGSSGSRARGRSGGSRGTIGPRGPVLSSD